jgi:hypothetical protein
MRLVPAPEEQKWLTKNLRKLIAKNGVERFVSAPVVEPTRRFFPDAWSGTVADVHIVTQRLMHMAGLGDLRVHMTTFGRSEYGHEVGWFWGFDEDRCKFGVAISQLRDPEAAAGVMAHEVAHAWRHKRELRAPSSDKEELLTDVTTVYLGFGILTTNNTYRYRSSGNWSVTRWSNSAVGYLPPDAMSFLLALQAFARNRRDEIRAIEKHLEPNQQACFEEAMHVLNDIDVLEELALPPRDSWPTRYELEPIEIDAPEEEELVEPPQPVETKKHNENEIAFARPRGGGAFSAIVAAFPGFLVGTLIAGILNAENGYLALGLMVVGAIGGAAIAIGYSRALVCSACAAGLAADSDTCPKCGAKIERHVPDNPEAAPGDWEECPDCVPEVPCARHIATVPIEEFAALATSDGEDCPN